jgi:hypothetical protein
LRPSASRIRRRYRPLSWSKMPLSARRRSSRRPFPRARSRAGGSARGCRCGRRRGWPSMMRRRSCSGGRLMARPLPLRSARQLTKWVPVIPSGRRTGHWDRGGVASCFGSTVGRGTSPGRKRRQAGAPWDQTGASRRKRTDSQCPLSREAHKAASDAAIPDQPTPQTTTKHSRREKNTLSVSVFKVVSDRVMRWGRQRTRLLFRWERCSTSQLVGAGSRVGSLSCRTRPASRPGRAGTEDFGSVKRSV